MSSSSRRRGGGGFTLGNGAGQVDIAPDNQEGGDLHWRMGHVAQDRHIDHDVA